ncbi:MAG: hypothetical protein JWO15_2608 [Sphingomonadales bacterium]|nr:hypothetical protein [Sphingomonadales bacterium]
MVVAKWEFRSLANMMISTHGDRVKAAVAIRLAEAEVSGHAGDIIVWNEVAKILPDIIAQSAPNKGPT